MNTPSHAIINMALVGTILENQGLPSPNLWIALGSIFPDIPIFVFYFWAKAIARLPEAQIWSEAYYAPVVQNIVSLCHSIPLAVMGLLIAVIYRSRLGQIFCISLILHSLGDLPVHNDDAHRHFFPLSNYRFISPISYWDPRHYGKVVSFLEICLVFLASLKIIPHINSLFGRILIIIINIFYCLSYAYFYQ
jgi:hypothetical protein